jgi:hypothetical protein
MAEATFIGSSRSNITRPDRLHPRGLTRRTSRNSDSTAFTSNLRMPDHTAAARHSSLWSSLPAQSEERFTSYVRRQSHRRATFLGLLLSSQLDSHSPLTLAAAWKTLMKRNSKQIPVHCRLHIREDRRIRSRRELPSIDQTRTRKGCRVVQANDSLGIC